MSIIKAKDKKDKKEAKLEIAKELKNIADKNFLEKLNQLLAGLSKLEKNN